MLIAIDTTTYCNIDFDKMYPVNEEFGGMGYNLDRQSYFRTMKRSPQWPIFPSCVHTQSRKMLETIFRIRKSNVTPPQTIACGMTTVPTRFKIQSLSKVCIRITVLGLYEHCLFAWFDELWFWLQVGNTVAKRLLTVANQPHLWAKQKIVKCGEKVKWVDTFF